MNLKQIYYWARVTFYNHPKDLRFFISFWDSIRGKKVWNVGYIRLYRPAEIVNVEVGMTVYAVNRSTGSIRLGPNFT